MIPRLTTVVICLLLAACASQNYRDMSSDQLRTMLHNEQINAWSITGKVGISTPEDKDSANLNWRQCQQDFDIRMSGPLGQGAAKLVGDAEQVTLTTNDGESLSARDPEQLLWVELGWRLPLNDLFYWVRGFPAPNAPGRITALTDGFIQSGWEVRYDRLTDQAPYTVPRKIIAQQRDIKVTLIIKQWDLTPNC